MYFSIASAALPDPPTTWFMFLAGNMSLSDAVLHNAELEFQEFLTDGG